MNHEELNKILENHKHWLKKMFPDGNECGQTLGRRTLVRQIFMEKTLVGASLSGIDLYRAYLYGTDLRNADLSKAYLHRADLRRANLYGANLYGANLSGANIREAKNIPFIPYACPCTGSFTGYKKAHGLIVELEIMEDARRCSATGRKCRCDKAKVLSIKNIDGSISDLKEIASDYNNDFIYTVGEIVEEPDFDEDRWSECTQGIHFFINFQEAVNY